MQEQDIQIKLTFLLEKRPLLQISTNHLSTTKLTVRQLLYHVLQTVSARKIQSMEHLKQIFPNMSLVYKDEALSMKLSLDSVIVKSQQLFYNLNNEEYAIIRGDKPIPSKKKENEKNPTKGFNQHTLSFNGQKQKRTSSQSPTIHQSQIQIINTKSSFYPIETNQIEPKLSPATTTQVEREIVAKDQNRSLNAVGKSSSSACCLII